MMIPAPPEYIFDPVELCPKVDPESGIDLTLIEENLKLTPWERILANDDTINFLETARAALAKRYAAA